MKIDLENDLEKPGVGPFWESGDPDLEIISRFQFFQVHNKGLNL